MAREAMAELRRMLAALERGPVCSAPGMVALGTDSLDAPLGGGLARGALHELHAERDVADAGAAAGFGLCVALRAAAARPIVWIRHAFAEREAGGLYGPGLSEFGLDPSRLTLLRVRDPPGLLRAADEAARCAALGAALVEIWGNPAVLDLRASRRLVLTLRRTGLTMLFVRLGAEPRPSAAPRGGAAAARGAPAPDAEAPGRPASRLRVWRPRAGIAGRDWSVEWDRDRLAFVDPAPLSRAVVPVPAGRPVAAEDRRLSA